jgi:cysteine desulfuration protein SufE
MVKKINEIQNEIIEEFSKLGDWFDKYEYIISLGKSLENSDYNLKSEDNLLKGCQSQLWIKSEINEGMMHYSADSDSLLTKGMISLVLRIVENQPAEKIIDADFYFIEKIGLNSNLSPSRANGLMSIVKHIKSSAKLAL